MRYNTELINLSGPTIDSGIMRLGGATNDLLSPHYLADSAQQLYFDHNDCNIWRID
jgi:hypothetical protein